MHYFDAGMDGDIRLVLYLRLALGDGVRVPTLTLEMQCFGIKRSRADNDYRGSINWYTYIVHKKS
jgi:hypothetical protein